MKSYFNGHLGHCPAVFWTCFINKQKEGCLISLKAQKKVAAYNSENLDI